MKVIGTTMKYCYTCKQETKHIIYENITIIMKYCAKCRGGKDAR